MCWYLMQAYGESNQHELMRIVGELKAFHRLKDESSVDSLQRHDMLVYNVGTHGVTCNIIVVQSLDLLSAFKVSKQMLPYLLFHTAGQIPSTVDQFNAMRTMMVNWSRLMGHSGPNSITVCIHLSHIDRPSCMGLP